MSLARPRRRGKLGVDYVRLRRDKKKELVLVGCPLIHRVGRHGEKASFGERMDDFGWSILLHFAPEKAEAWRQVDGRAWLPALPWAGGEVAKAYVLSLVANRERSDQREAVAAQETRRLAAEQTRRENERKERGEFVDSPFRLARRSWPLHPGLSPARWATATSPGRLFEELSTWGEFFAIPLLIVVTAYRYAPTTTSLIGLVYLASYLAFVATPRYAAGRIIREKEYKGLLRDELLALAHYSWSLALASGRWWAPMAPLRLVPTRDLLRTTPMFQAGDPYGTLRRAMIVRWRAKVGARRVRSAHNASVAMR